MKRFVLAVGVLFMAAELSEALAQTRGPRYNPGRGSSSSGGSRSSGSSASGGSGGGSRPSHTGPRYNPSRGSSSSGSSSRPSSSRPSGSRPSSSRPSGGSSSGGSGGGSRPSTTGPRYNPPSRPTTTTPSRPSTTTPSRPTTTGPRYNPPSTNSGSSTPSTTGPRYNPPGTNTGSTPSTTTPTRPTGPRYNPPVNNGSNPPVIRGPRYNPPTTPRPYVVVRPVIPHRPYGNVVVHPPMYPQPASYHVIVRRYHIYRYWIMEPVWFTYRDGYNTINNYPYYVYHGYRHRYSRVDMCQYELVDGTQNSVVKTYALRECNVAYDECATERDQLNDSVQEERYFCAERVSDDLSNDGTVFNPNPTDISTELAEQIRQYLLGKSYQDLFEDGAYGEFGQQCVIWKLRGNPHGCKHTVTVNDEYFPDPEGVVCSEDSQAALVNCNVGSEQENAGCILKQAIEMGYCHQ